MSTQNIFYIALALLIIGNLYASYITYRSSLYSKEQKTLQFFLIWALPILGGLTVYLVDLHDRRPDLIESAGDKNSLDDPNVTSYVIGGE